MPHLAAPGVGGGPGTDLYLVDRGAGPDAILFAHGLFFTHAVWEPQLASLSDRWRCVAWDLRGHGQSGGDARDLDVHVADAARIVTALSLGPVHVVGASLGGRVALRLASRHPELVRSVVLLGTAIDRAPATQRRAFRAVRVAARVLGTRWAAARLAGQLVGPAYRATHPEVVAQLAAAPASAWDAAEVVLDATFDDPLPAVPASVLLGEADTGTAPSRVAALHAALPGSRLVRIPGAGHLMSREAPDAVTAAIRAFLLRQSKDAEALGVSASGALRVERTTPTL